MQRIVTIAEAEAERERVEHLTSPFQLVPELIFTFWRVDGNEANDRDAREVKEI